MITLSSKTANRRITLAWSDAAREAALEARKEKEGGKEEPPLATIHNPLNYEGDKRAQTGPYRVGKTVSIKGGYYHGIRGTVQRAEQARHGFRLTLRAEPNNNRGSNHPVVGHSFVFQTDPRDQRGPF